MRFFCLVFFVCLVSVSNLFANENEEEIGKKQIPRQYTFQIGMYLNGMNREVQDADTLNSRAMFFADTIHLVFWGLNQRVSTVPLWVKASIRSSEVLLDYFHTQAFLTSMHELGHVKILNMAEIYSFEFSSPYVTGLANPNMFEMYPYSYGGKASVISEQKDWNRYLQSKYFAYHDVFETMLSAGGVNQVQYFNESVSYKILQGTAHPLTALTYLMSAKEVLSYGGYGRDKQGGDMYRYQKVLEKRGIKTTQHLFKTTAQLFKILASRSTYLSIASLLDFSVGNKNAFAFAIEQKLSFLIGKYRIFWPDFASYLTSYGPTLKMILPVKISNTICLLGYESNQWLVKSGKHLREYSLQIETSLGCFSKHLNNLKIRLFGAVNHGGGLWLEAEARYLYGIFEVGVQGYVGRGASFVREVRGHSFAFIKKNESGIKLYVGLKVKF